MGFEPTPFRNRALIYRLRPLGHFYLVIYKPFIPYAYPMETHNFLYLLPNLPLPPFPKTHPNLTNSYQCYTIIISENLILIFYCWCDEKHDAWLLPIPSSSWKINSCIVCSCKRERSKSKEIASDRCIGREGRQLLDAKFKKTYEIRTKKIAKVGRDGTKLFSVGLRGKIKRWVRRSRG